MSFIYERYDVRGCACDECDTGTDVQAEFDGQWVKADDAINREAVLQAKIRTLETQLKDARMFGHAARQAALEEAAGIAESCILYATTTAQSIAKAIREKKEGA